ncbi:ATP-dependent Clp protease proteolytic subunit-related protein 3, chloroplastic-like isoform X1 [Daucus carota subsp. sativus]|uniref:ATP-dependent Clp protease proteolytic subunit-related protein 3, chloroplastic-like isoform X1 n=1 Tax=Daucus carota subsp. sativus TaxID=79200 RepID=UPI0030838A96
MNGEMHTVAAAIVQACLLLAAGSKGKRFMMPYTKAMIQQPRVPSSGLMPATDLLIRAKEVIINRDITVDLASTLEMKSSPLGKRRENKRNVE